jgi:hypothetical protein
MRDSRQTANQARTRKRGSWVFLALLAAFWLLVLWLGIQFFIGGLFNF